MTTAEMTDEKQERAKTDAILEGCLRAETVPMEHEIVIKFVTNFNLDIKNLDKHSKEDVQNAIKEDTDAILEGIDKFVEEYIKNNERRGLVQTTYATSPYGLCDCMKRQGLKKLLTGLAEKL